MLEIAAAYLKQADRISGEPTPVHLLNEEFLTMLKREQDL
jgi:hypothetical protein